MKKFLMIDMSTTKLNEGETQIIEADTVWDAFWCIVTEVKGSDINYLGNNVHMINVDDKHVVAVELPQEQ